MTVADLFLPLVFLAGAVSFLSPCVVPLVPGYVSVIGGAGLHGGDGRAVTRRTLGATAAFLAGFLAFFVALGASASALGSVLAANRGMLDRSSGLFIIAMGLVSAGVFPSPFARRFSAATSSVVGRLRTRGGPLALGVAFAFCWTPCVGPVLAGVLAYAASTATLQDGVLLLTVYGLGLATPFLLLGLAFGRFAGRLGPVRRLYRPLQLVSGVLLVAMGALVFSGRLWIVNAYAQRWLSAIGLDWWTSL